MAKPQRNNRRRAPREPKEFEEEVIQIDRVTRVVKGGRRLRFRATVVVGNKKGKVGVGVGKSTEVQGAIQKAISQAKKSLITVPMAGQTIPHRVKLKYKSAHLLLMPACPGTGIIAGGPLRKIVELAGVEDILSKSLGNNNKLTNSQAAIRALGKLQQIPWLKSTAPQKAEGSSPGKESKNPNKDTKKEAKKAPVKAARQSSPDEKKASTEKAVPKATKAKKEDQ